MESTGKGLAIVGGGAAGLAAAIAAGERARGEGLPLEITVYESDDRVGRSILATGNGRCNFSNEHPYADDYRNEEFVEKAFYSLMFSFGANATDRDRRINRDNGHMVNAFFYRHGLMWRVEDDGRQYPRTNKASTVVDVLRRSAANVGVREACERAVTAIEAPQREGGRFMLRFSGGEVARADTVIVACGGRALPALDVCGLGMVPQEPVLGPLRCAEVKETRELDNLRVRCDVSLCRGDGDSMRKIACERGELLFRKYGVSGICVFNLSRFARPGDTLRVNFLDGDDLESAKRYLFSRRKLLTGTFGAALTCGDMTSGLLLPRVSEVVLKRVGLRMEDRFEKSQVEALAQAMVDFRLQVEGIGDEGICQVRRGGLDVASFDPRTMESREVPGLYAAGEALDVDGPCGGYNLHWAWASGLLAGRSAVERLPGSSEAPVGGGAAIR